MQRRLNTALGVPPTLLRFVAAAIASVWIAFVVWQSVGSAHPIFRSLAPSGLVSWALSGIVGGLVAALIAPRRKLMFAFLTGCTFALVLLTLMPSAHGRNPWLWYAPAYLPFFYFLGGLLGRHYWHEPVPLAHREHP